MTILWNRTLNPFNYVRIIQWVGSDKKRHSVARSFTILGFGCFPEKAYIYNYWRITLLSDIVDIIDRNVIPKALL